VSRTALMLVLTGRVLIVPARWCQPVSAAQVDEGQVNNVSLGGRGAHSSCQCGQGLRVSLGDSLRSIHFFSLSQWVYFCLHIYCLVIPCIYTVTRTYLTMRNFNHVLQC
jgi:hypothetical protein